MKRERERERERERKRERCIIVEERHDVTVNFTSFT
jgi:hypothetical protein